MIEYIKNLTKKQQVKYVLCMPLLFITWLIGKISTETYNLMRWLCFYIYYFIEK